VIGVMGVIFFILNAAFALVLLILVLISSIYALVSKNPDVRYQPMRDDRASFIKSNSQMVTSTELDALGVTARGDVKGGYKTRDLEDDDSYTTDSMTRQRDASQIPLPPSTAGSHSTSHHTDTAPSPLSPAVPLFPSNNDSPRSMYKNPMAQHSNQLSLLTTSGVPRSPNRSGTPSPVPSARSPGGFDSNRGVERNNTGGSMNWHTGAGYDNHRGQ
jgi:hypothetical protein